MIAKKITAPKGGGRTSVLMRYVVNAQGGADPRSWAATASYILDAEAAQNSTGEKVSAVRVTNCASDDPITATMEIEALQSKYQGRSKAAKTYHLVFSFPPGEQPPQDVLHNIEDELCKALGMEDHQRISAVHIDRDHYHVHVAINSVTPDGKRLISSPSHEKRKLMQTCEAMEIRHGLSRTNHGLETEQNNEREREAINRADDPARPEIHPLAIPEPNTAFRRYLRKCHYSEFARGSGEAANGMHDLPRGSLVYDKDRSAVLLSGDAVAHVDDGAAQDHPNLRRSDSGHRGPSSAGRIRAAAMEAKAGVETLAGYVAREVAPAIRDAVTWQEVHDALGAHGLTIKRRGAGLVLGDSDLDLWCKASTIDRDFSLRGLETALGTFAAPAQKQGSGASPTPAQKYAAKPVAAGQDASQPKLFDRYKQERAALARRRSDGLTAISAQHRKTLDEIKRWAASQRVTRQMTTRGARKKVASMTAFTQAKAARKAAAEQAAQAKAALIATTKAPAWNDWLTARAQAGDSSALAFMRARQNRNDKALGGLFSVDRAATVAARLLQDRSRTVRPNGSVEYRAADGGRVIDHAGRITMPENTPGACLIALEVMEVRFPGQALAMNGDNALAQTMAALAGKNGVGVTFADPRLEVIRAGTARLNTAKAPAEGMAEWIANRNHQRAKISSILEHRAIKSDDSGAAKFAGRRQLEDKTMVLLFEQNQKIIVKSADAKEQAAAAAWSIGQAVTLHGMGSVRAATKGRRK